MVLSHVKSDLTITSENPPLAVFTMITLLKNVIHYLSAIVICYGFVLSFRRCDAVSFRHRFYAQLLTSGKLYVRYNGYVTVGL